MRSLRGQKQPKPARRLATETKEQSESWHVVGKICQLSRNAVCGELEKEIADLTSYNSAII